MPVTLTDIHDKLTGIEDAIVGKWKTTPLWLKILAGVVIIVLIIQVWSMFKKREPVDNSYLQKMDQLDSTIKYQQKYIESLQEQQAMRDTIIMSELGRISGNKQTQTRIIHEYQSIPDRVNNLNREELRKQISDY